MKRLLISAAISLSLGVTNAYAGEKSLDDVDPADLTSVSTSMYLGASNQGDVKLTGTAAGSLQGGSSFMGILEAEMDEEGDYTKSRLRYFHSFNTDLAWAPKVGGSLDIIDNTSMTTAAIGAIALIPSPLPNLMFFPQIAGVTGKLKSDFVDDLEGAAGNDFFAGKDDKVNGYMAAFFTSIRLDDKGSYFTFWPEITELSGDADITVTKFTVHAGTPINDERSKWLTTLVESSSTDMDFAGTTMPKVDETVAWFNFRAYF